MDPMTAEDFTDLARGLYLEGLAVDDRTVFYGDVIGGGVHRLTPAGELTDWLPELRWFGSIALNDDGTVLTSGIAGISWLDPVSGRSGLLLGEVDGKPLPGVNEMCPDGRGGLYFGTKDGAAIARGEPPSPSGLFHVDAGGNGRQLCDGLVFTNGIALSLDRTTLFHNETFVGTFAYPILADGSLGERRMLLEKPDCDGMVTDAEGNLWIVGYQSDEILQVSPDGEIIGGIRVPPGAVTNLRFGGADARDLYLTSVPSDAGEGLRVGNLPSEPRSVLYRTHSPVAGRVQPRTGFDLAATTSSR
jgi:sugar lactone lactonase YvrE